MTSPTHLALRAGSCSGCGRLVAHHFGVRNLWIGCAGARRVNQSLEPTPEHVAQSVRALELIGGAGERDREREIGGR